MSTPARTIDAPKAEPLSAVPGAQQPAGGLSERVLGRWRSAEGSLLLVLGGLFIARLLAMLVVPLTDPTEARYAEIARKMLETGDWITPQIAYGVPFWGKPPLHTWLSAAGMGIFGVNEFGTRIGIFLAACALLWLLYRWCAELRGRAFALNVLVVLASSALFFGASAFVMTDMVMTFGTTLSMIAFWRASVTGDRASGYLFFVGLGIGLLAKGPIAVVLTGMPIGLWVILGRRWSTLRHLPWVGGAALVLAIAGPWYAAAEHKTPGFLHYFIVGEHFQRFVQSGWSGDLYGWGHSAPKGSIWLYALLACLPWSLFALALIARPRAVHAAFRNDSSGLRAYLLLWMLAPLVFFTMAANILPAYVLPGTPAAAVLLVQLWTDVWDGGRTDGTRRPFIVAAGASLLGFMVLIGTLAIAPERAAIRSQKSLVQEAEQLAPGADLYYWKEHIYSADFYSHGQARTLGNAAQLRDLPANGKRICLVARKKKFAKLPAELRRRFVEIGSIGQHTLFIGNNVPAENS